MNIVQLFIDKAKETPHHLALVDGRKRVTYGELHELMLHSVHQFVYQGVQEGDRVMVVVPTSVETYKIVLALWHIGATAVFMEEWAFKNHFHQHKSLLDCHAVILSPKIKLLTYFRSDFKSIPLHLSDKTFRTSEQPSSSNQ